MPTSKCVRSPHQPNNIMPKAKSASKPNTALMKPVQPDDTLAKIVGSKPLPRSEVTKKMWDYIKKNKLQDAKKKTLINADDALKSVFGGKKQVTMFEMKIRFWPCKIAALKSEFPPHAASPPRHASPGTPIQRCWCAAAPGAGCQGA